MREPGSFIRQSFIGHLLCVWRCPVWETNSRGQSDKEQPSSKSSSSGGRWVGKLREGQCCGGKKAGDGSGLGILHSNEKATAMGPSLENPKM